jgi:anti-sigma regulatory factor (Ser/Thr protein kinase)
VVTSPHLLRFPPRLAGVDEAARALRVLLEAGSVDGDTQYAIELAFEELATNIVRYGSPSGDIEAEIAFTDDEVVLTFEDNGVPFDPGTHPEAATPASIDEAQVGGLGLTLVRRFSTRLTYERTPEGRNRVMVGFARRREPSVVPSPAETG